MQGPICGSFVTPGQNFCSNCVRWSADDSLELTVTGTAANEVDTVARRMGSELAAARMASQQKSEARSRK